MPPKGYYFPTNFVSFIYLCYDKILGYSLQTNELPYTSDDSYSAKFVFELEARHGCYDMGKFISSIKNNDELSNLPAEVFAKWISVNWDHLSHLPKTIWE